MSRMGYVRLVLELFHFSNELKLKNISQLRESISKSIIVGVCVCVWLGVCVWLKCLRTPLTLLNI